MRVALSTKRTMSSMVLSTSLALFIAMPWLLRHGWSFHPSLLAGGALTVGLYGIEVRVLGAFGIKL